MRKDAWEAPWMSSELHKRSRIIPRVVSFILALVPPLACTAEPPRVEVDTDLTQPSGELIHVVAGDDLQAALDAAEPGDILELEAGATFTGSFTLPRKAETEWIHIRSSDHGALPSPGVRVGPSDAALMPKIVTPNGMPAISAAQGAHHYRFIGVEIRPADTVYANNVVLLGSGTEASESDLPHHIIFDRSYIHANPLEGTRRGIAMNGKSMAVMDSYLSGFKDTVVDSQAVAGWNGPGPFKIINNYLEGAGENVMFGGSAPSITGLVPSDIEIRNNHFYKPLTWKIDHPSYEGVPWSVKNLLELKNARRVLIDGNVLEHNWPHSQNGFAILFTVRNENGKAPWAVVEDVTFTNNLVRQVGAGINVLGHDDNEFPSEQTKRIRISNNLFENVGGEWGGGRLFQILNGAAAIWIKHNTAFQSGPLIMADGAPTSGLVHRDNITMEGNGVLGTGTSVGIDTLNTYFPDAVYTGNVQIGGNLALYPLGNHFPATVDEVGFENWSEGEYRLVDSSPYKNISADGKDAGADFNALEAAIMGVVDGKRSARVEEKEYAVRCSPCAWYPVERPMFSNDRIISAAEAGASVVFDFVGTAVRWIGYRDEWSGTAEVYLDGAFQEIVGTYASPARAQEVLFSADGLADEPHRIVIEVTGEKNANADGSWISVDAFDVESSTQVVRIEEDDPSVSCSPCGWYSADSSVLSAGSARAAIKPGASMFFDFTGTGVSWIGYRDGWSGTAKVYLDGSFRKEVDTYAPVDEPQAVLYATSDLAPGPHRLAVQVTGDRNPDSADSWIWVDAFEHIP